MRRPDEKCDRWCVILNALTASALLALVVPVFWFVVSEVTEPPGGDWRTEEAAVLYRSADATGPVDVRALWQYQQLRMDKCAWCARTVNMNRHHVIPQAANPALRDVKSNLVVLCRDCHFVLGHRCNWKQYNPDVLYICTHFTNCVKSADTRHALPDGPTRPPPEMSDAQRRALERILQWNNTNTNTPSAEERPPAERR